MITIKKLFEKYAEHLVDSDHEFEGYFIDEEDFILAVKEYTREAIKADRENVSNHIKLEFVPYDSESWTSQTTIKRIDIIDFYREEEDEDWGYGQLKERDGFEIGVNKDSIINAPEIELL